MLAISRCRITQKHPQSPSSAATGTLTLLYRQLAWSSLAVLSSHSHQDPIVESRDQHQCFLLFFLDTLSVFVLWTSKPQRICNQGPLAVLCRRDSGEPSADWVQTLNISLFTRGAASFMLWRQATLQNPHPTACQSPLKKGSNWTGLQDEATQKPGAICAEQTSRDRYRLCEYVSVFACLCPAAVLQFRRHHSLAGSSETPSWVISNSCAHLGREKKLPSHNLGPLLGPVTAPNTLWTTNTAVPAS